MFKRVNKSKARKLYAAGENIAICPVKAGVLSDFAMMIHYDGLGVSVMTADLGDLYDSPEEKFDHVVNSFEYYNCNCEMGRYAAFYVKCKGATCSA
jgi:hypothetical protein